MRELHLGDLASAIGNADAVVTEARAVEAAIVAELQAGSEEAFTWLVTQLSSTVYGSCTGVSMIPRSDRHYAGSFLKVFRGMSTV